MKRKAVIAVLALTAILNSHSLVNAEIQTYTDQCLSFQYDDEMQGAVLKMCGDDYARYDFFSKDCQVSLAVRDRLEWDKLGGSVIALNDNQAIKFNYEEDKINDECRQFMDSVKVEDPEDFVYEYPGKDTDSSYVFRNKCYSEQAIIYAQKAYDTINDYLSLNIDADEADDIISELERRSESFMDGLSYNIDRDVYFALFSKSLFISLGDDKEMMEVRDRLKEIIDVGYYE